MGSHCLILNCKGLKNRIMDAIRKKRQSLKSEIEELTENADDNQRKTEHYNDTSDQCDCDIRDVTKKISKFESGFETTAEQLLANQMRLQELDMKLNEEDGKVSSLNRRVMLLEVEENKAEGQLGYITLELAKSSKKADDILKKVKSGESKTMNNEVTIEELDKSVREANIIKGDGQHKLEELSRRLGVLDDEFARSTDRADLCDKKVMDLEDELKMIGENMKALEVAEEKAFIREEKYLGQILVLMEKLKIADQRQEYGEKNINKLNHRVDEIEDDIIRQKLKIQKIAGELDNTFDEMFTIY